MPSHAPTAEGRLDKLVNGCAILILCSLASILALAVAGVYSLVTG